MTKYMDIRKLHKDLSSDEEEEFKQWARDNYVPFYPINGTWHPVIQAECAKINDQQEIDMEWMKRKMLEEHEDGS